MKQSRFVNEMYARTPPDGSSRALHLAMATLINAIHPERLIDFGCGDGRLLPLVRARAKYAFDPAPEMLASLLRQHGRECREVYRHRSEVPDRSFDSVVFSLVLPWLESEQEVHETFKDLARISAPRAQVLIGTTHPCFRSGRYSDFYTGYALDPAKPFPYRQDRAKFAVTVLDHTTGQPVTTFQDTHWTLSFTFAALRSSGLVVEQITEVYDTQVESSDWPPYLLFVCRSPE